MIRIGISADLSSNGSIHQDTFIRAVTMASENLNLEEKGIELIWENDFATSGGGIIAAKNNMKHQVDCVVGHYASSAAKGALGVYNGQIPVFLPAATADELTNGCKGAFRLCGKDDDLAEFIKDEFEKDLPHTLYVESDRSTHGFALSFLIKQKLKELSNITVTNYLDDAERIIFVGNYSSSLKFCEKNKNILSRIDQICFTDDLVRPELPENLNFIDQNVHVFGYQHALQYKSAQEINAQYYKEWGSYPLTYFLETYAALEIIEQLATMEKATENWMNLIRANEWRTCLGPLSFDLKGDSNFKRFAKWSIENTQLVVVENYN